MQRKRLEKKETITREQERNNTYTPVINKNSRKMNGKGIYGVSTSSTALAIKPRKELVVNAALSKTQTFNADLPDPNQIN